MQMKNVIQPVDRKLLLKELRPDRFMRDTNYSGNQIYTFTAHEAPNLMQEVGRTRELTFREAGGGTGEEVDIDYYKNLIEDPNIDIYVAKNDDGKIIGFVSIHGKKYDIIKVRDVIGKLSFENKKTKDLLINEKTEFAYLDQVSILPEYKRKGVGTAIFQKGLLKINRPVVAFIVEKPIFNKASVYWHEQNGFEFSAISGGEYKGKTFKFQVFVHWNEK